MESTEFPQPMENRKDSYVLTSPPTPQKLGITTKIRQTINSAAKRTQTNSKKRLSGPDLSNLTPQCQVNERRISFCFQLFQLRI